MVHLVVADGDGLVHVVADRPDLGGEELVLLARDVDEVLLLLLESSLLLEEVAGVFLCLDTESVSHDTLTVGDRRTLFFNPISF